MADKKISELVDAAPLTGDEQIEVLRSSSNLRTTAQEIANLSSGGSLPFKIASGRISADGTLLPGSVNVNGVSGPSGSGVFTVDVTSAGFTNPPAIVATLNDSLAGGATNATISNRSDSTATALVIQITKDDAAALTVGFAFTAVGT